MSYTKGPWKIVGYNGEHEEAGAVICGPNGERIATTSSVVELEPKEWKLYFGNALLISTAPELLKELKEAKELVRRWHCMGLPDERAELVWSFYQKSPEMKHLNAIIAKAEGEQS